MFTFFTWPLQLLEETRATRTLLSALMNRTYAELSDMNARLTQLEITMSAATDALNSAVSDLAKASEAMVSKITEEATKIDELLKGDDTPEVDAATARIRQMTSELNDKLTALGTSAAAVSNDAGNGGVTASDYSNSVPPVGAGVDGGAGPELAGVPATPGGVGAEATGPAVPSSDFIETETSPNKDTSGPAPTTASGVGPAAPDAPAEETAAAVAPAPVEAPAEAPVDGAPTLATDEPATTEDTSTKSSRRSK